MSALLDRIDEVLDAVYDPCSVAVRAPISVANMGLIREREVDADGHVRVRMCVTGPSCMLVGSMVKGIEERVAALPGVASVTVDIDADYLWTEADMRATGRQVLADARAESRRRLPVEPLGWKRRPQAQPAASVRPAAEPS
jgi:Predicted metal-sulfur cluster biosynthetic enzyme